MLKQEISGEVSVSWYLQMNILIFLNSYNLRIGCIFFYKNNSFMSVKVEQKIYVVQISLPMCL